MRLEIFDRDTNERLDIIRMYKYVQYRNDFNDVGLFSLTIPVEEESLKYLVEGNYIWFEDNVVGVIYYREKVEDEKKKDVVIKGFLSNYLLSYRCFDKTYYYEGDIGIITKNMINDLIINPNDVRRKINVLSASEKSLGITKNVQVTGHQLNEVIQEMLATNDCGYEMKVEFDKSIAKINTFRFNPIKPQDRSKRNTYGNSPVIFSFEMDNLSYLDYVEDSTEYCSVAYVAGEGQNKDRKIIECGKTELSGLDRRELYVDARDIQSVKINDKGQEVVIPEAEYNQQLIQRGLERLSDFDYSISFDGSVIEGNKFYKYGEDFSLGDLVTVEDSTMMLEFDLQISSVMKTISEDGDSHFDIQFGKDKISIRKLVKKGGY